MNTDVHCSRCGMVAKGYIAVACGWKTWKQSGSPLCSVCWNHALKTNNETFIGEGMPGEWREDADTASIGVSII